MDYPVGLESQVQKVRKLLDVGFDDVVHMVRMHKLKGIGKTTVVVAVYNSLLIILKVYVFLKTFEKLQTNIGYNIFKATFFLKQLERSTLSY